MNMFKNELFELMNKDMKMNDRLGILMAAVAFAAFAYALLTVLN
jgi:hypothetical protein